jgi:alkylated DNA repair dioxygenase AlkB
VRIGERAPATESVERHDLGGGAFVEHDRRFYGDVEAEAVGRALVGEVRWEQREIVLFGKRILQPRLVGWSGELAYRYSGQTLEPRQFGPALAELRARVEARVGARFNHALVNRYRDGRDSMGWHSDDEPELGDAPLVVSVSFGAARQFVLRHRRRRGRARSFQLGGGSLLVMGGTCQQEFRHALPKDPRVHGERINVTFRLLLAEPRGPVERRVE